MIYPFSFESKIGFDKVREMIAGYTLSEIGKEYVTDLVFQTSFARLQEDLGLTEEFIRILESDTPFPTDYFLDMRPALQRARIEGVYLDEQEIFALSRSLQTHGQILSFFENSVSSDEQETPLYPLCLSLSKGRSPYKDILKALEKILNPIGQIKDNASPELARIRSEISSTMGSISKTLNSILKKAQADGYVDKEMNPTMRDGRLVIPVIPTYKRKIRGIIHDESATGKTLFIEPEQVVEANNKIRELEAMQKREIVRILTAFTAFLRPYIEDLLESYLFMGLLDFIRAKAIWSRRVGAHVPVLSKDPIIDWNNAIHPLLYLSLDKQNKEIIPLDITLTAEKRMLIISGPNAGGKSVCLKTVGLLQYMWQCGIPIPISPTSTVGMFDSLLIDIGDEQSIENDLSTYSSHLMNMKFFIKNSSPNSLILIDEFGTGTEPQIGGALAEAVLKRICNNQSFGVITTHYQNLKHFADHTEGVINGAMLYDRHIMQPLFQLRIGNPGSSFAIEIARKIGLPEDVIEEASQKVGEDYVNMDKFLQDIVRDKRYWEQKRQQIRLKEKKFEDLTAEYEQSLSQTEKQRKEIIRTAKTEAEALLKQANAKIENTIRSIKEAEAEKELTKLLRKDLQEFKQQVQNFTEEDGTILRQMEKLRRRQERKEQPKQKAQASESRTKDPHRSAVIHSTGSSIEKGSAVRIKGQSAVGEVIELNGKKATVAFGALKSVVKTDQLEAVSRSQAKKDIPRPSYLSDQTKEIIKEKKMTFKYDLDVRGLRADEALQVISIYIDDAIQVGAEKIRILHGTGTGALRELTRQYLATVPGVDKFADEHIQFGGAGITVVDLE